MDKKKMSISVAMATYNGEKYIKEQLNSIIPQLDENDEIIISDDKSTDGTRIIIEDIMAFESRIKLIEGPCRGIVKNFENAIKNCKNGCIFLSDQDDIWNEKKVQEVTDFFDKSGADLILHNARILSENGDYSNETFFEKRGCCKGLLRNIMKNSYIGCCLAFKSDVKSLILPFPEKIPMHDQWIGIICEEFRNTEFLDLPLISYRRHESNASGDKHSSFVKMLGWRINLIGSLISRSRKIKKVNFNAE